MVGVTVQLDDPVVLHRDPDRTGVRAIVRAGGVQLARPGQRVHVDF
jgi:hypothetical protein